MGIRCANAPEHASATSSAPTCSRCSRGDAAARGRRGHRAVARRAPPTIARAARRRHRRPRAGSARPTSCITQLDALRSAADRRSRHRLGPAPRRSRGDDALVSLASTTRLRVRGLHARRSWTSCARWSPSWRHSPRRSRRRSGHDGRSTASLVAVPGRDVLLEDLAGTPGRSARPRSVVRSSPSTYTGAFGSSNVPGSEIPMLACFDSPGPFTTHPITATLHLLDARVSRPPHRHLLAQVGLDVLRHLLEEGGRRAPAARACRHLRREAAQPQRLQDLLRDEHLLGAVAVRRAASARRGSCRRSLPRAGSTARRCWRRCPSFPAPLRSARGAAGSRTARRGGGRPPPDPAPATPWRR